MRASEHAPRGPFQLLERRHGLADIVERGDGVPVERVRVPIKRILTFTMAPAASCYATLGFVTFYFAVTLLAMCPIEANLRFIAAAWYMAFAAIVAYTRYRVRRHRQILHGDVLTDMCIAVLFYPLALVQHEKELRAPDDFYIPEKESEEKEA